LISCSCTGKESEEGALFVLSISFCGVKYTFPHGSATKLTPNGGVAERHTINVSQVSQPIFEDCSLKAVDMVYMEGLEKGTWFAPRQ
jgi:hypothetical protein